MQRFDPGFGFSGGSYTIRPLYAPAVNYNTEFPQLGSAHQSPVAVEQQPRPIAQHMPVTWSAAQATNAIGYGPDGVMGPYSPGHIRAPVRSSVFMHASQQYAIPSRPGVPFVHPQESMGPFAQVCMRFFILCDSVRSLLPYLVNICSSIIIEAYGYTVYGWYSL
jgi:hypothetical protein